MIFFSLPFLALTLVSPLDGMARNYNFHLFFIYDLGCARLRNFNVSGSRYSAKLIEKRLDTLALRSTLEYLLQDHK